MVLQPATNAAGAADDRVTALARTKLAEFQRVLGHENIMKPCSRTLEPRRQSGCAKHLRFEVTLESQVKRRV